MKKAILLVAFGVSSLQGQRALKCFDARARARFPGISVRWAFTSILLRERLASARLKSDSVRKALYKCCFEKFDRVVVQPLQTIAGEEYADVCVAVDEVASQMGIEGRVGCPLLTTEEDVRLAAKAVMRHLPQTRNEEEDVIFMGHGARHAAVSRYGDLDTMVRLLDSRVHVGAMNGAVALEEILLRLSSSRVWLMPLLSVVGRHALMDMAGEQGDSWRSRIEATGRKCMPVLAGTVEHEGFAEIWLNHLAEAVAAPDAAASARLVNGDSGSRR
ncbi:MAG: sirohydrochlorin cobaltochelatase [Desulfovibrio sp.]|jgi:sirohydrochlorin cobaltochelatase|nr:sirohydrochlorin cobaltochelatase [Desulfovibrio sp.]